MEKLKNIWTSVATWFEGKKTILGGSVILLAVVAGVVTSKIDPTTGAAVAGFGLSIIGYGDKANRHQAQILTALQGVAKAGADIRTGNPIRVEQDIAVTAAQILPETFNANLPPLNGISGGLKSAP